MNKKFVGGNSQLHVKILEISSKDSVHQFVETVKAITDYVGQEYTHGGDIRFMMKILKIIILFVLQTQYQMQVNLR
jgi:hypothetical protein